MPREFWEPDMKALFVGVAADETSDKLGFYHLDPKDRFWELIELGGITPKRVISASERKALAEGHQQGSVADPIRVLYVEKKTSQLRQLGIGITDLNQRVIAANDKDKAALPTDEDIQRFAERTVELRPKTIGFLMRPELFLDLFKRRYQGATDAVGLQPFTIGTAEVWLLGSTTTRLRGEALTKQEDAFFNLGERIEAMG